MGPDVRQKAVNHKRMEYDGGLACFSWPAGEARKNEVAHTTMSQSIGGTEGNLKPPINLRRETRQHKDTVLAAATEQLLDDMMWCNSTVMQAIKAFDERVEGFKKTPEERTEMKQLPKQLPGLVRKLAEEILKQTDLQGQRGLNIRNPSHQESPTTQEIKRKKTLIHTRHPSSIPT
jgi:hypothetical protein